MTETAPQTIEELKTADLALLKKWWAETGLSTLGGCRTMESLEVACEALGALYFPETYVRVTDIGQLDKKTIPWKTAAVKGVGGKLPLRNQSKYLNEALVEGFMIWRMGAVAPPPTDKWSELSTTMPLGPYPLLGAVLSTAIEDDSVIASEIMAIYNIFNADGVVLMEQHALSGNVVPYSSGEAFGWLSGSMLSVWECWGAMLGLELVGFGARWSTFGFFFQIRSFNFFGRLLWVMFVGLWLVG